MRRLLLLTLALPLAACGGSGNDGENLGGCTADYVTTPNAAFAGAYTATYTPSGSAVGGSLSFTLTVATDGTVLGTVNNPSTGPGNSVPVAGTALDVRNGCTKTTVLALAFTFGDNAPESLTVAKGQNDSVVGTFQGPRTQNGENVSLGKLVVKLAAPVE